MEVPDGSLGGEGRGRGWGGEGWDGVSPALVFEYRPWRRAQLALAQATQSPRAQGAVVDVSALHPSLGCQAEQGPWS